jgi:hypothetical protein
VGDGTGTETAVSALPWVYDDGGRTAAGWKGGAGDCVARSIAIGTGLPYRAVYDELARRNAERKRGGPRSARNGLLRRVYEPLLFDLGWIWDAHMRVGAGCRTHMAVGEIPAEGRLIVAVSRHLTAVVDGVVRDTHDPCRGGTRCVYGWYEPGSPEAIEAGRRLLGIADWGLPPTRAMR